MILDMQQQVASPMRCQELYALGAPENTVHQWYCCRYRRDPENWKLAHRPGIVIGKAESHSIPDAASPEDWIAEWWPAYSVAELGALIPRDIPLPIKTKHDEWVLRLDELTAWEKTEADARANLLVWLIATGKVKASDLVADPGVQG